ncbi:MULTISPECIES: ABC transporter permease subunit [Cellulomonas]|uniref:Putative ABC transporter transmembrane protein n=1 Tax=Cellulomonas gilvus (strain ATCC 13127 / NRRL B-14078) TaxID=593907 RepID=F8A7A5_CELGA|nr:MULTISPECIES: ABC transporter permease subunit [Cellulomonas]AEI11163.1 putative ABC transporter transmembrane protein [Cellulomonas gilvus ATCC 13127]MCR6687981.1 ABC transporter permease subunit [Cellulomonas sp.]
MSAATLTPTPVPEGIPAKPGVTFPRLVRSEWIKFWTVRSTVWTVSVMAVVVVALVALISLIIAQNVGEMDAGDGLPALVPYSVAVNLASLAVVVLGVLTITGEYTTGMIRASLSAAPRRTPVLWAKLVVLGGSMMVIATVVVALAAAVQTPILSPKNVALDLGDAETVRVLFGNALYLATITVFAFAFGALLRHSAAAMASVLGLLLVVENAVLAIPWRPLEYVRPFMPASAGYRVAQPQEMIDAMNDQMGRGIELSAWGGYAVLVGWVLVLLAVAAVLLKRRDA